MANRKGDPPPASRVRRLADELIAALSVWAARDDSKPQPEVRRAANAAMDAIDDLLLEVYEVRARLTGEIRAVDDATARRVDEMLRRRDGEQ